MRIAFCLLLLLAFNANATPAITQFYDGDTIKITDGSLEYKLRITDIDAPERNQHYGKKSRRALMQLCKHASIKIIVTGTDKYYRKLGKLHCNQQDVSLFMVKNGHAWFNRPYSADGSIAIAEQTAKQNKLGLWKSKKPMPPWVWRQKHPHPNAK